MRLCIINQINDRTETALCVELYKRGHDVTYIGNSKDPALVHLANEGLRTIKLDVVNRIDLRAIKFLRKFFRHNQFDAYYIPTAKILSVSFFAGIEKSPIFSYRGSLSRISRFNPFDRFSYFNKKLTKVICNSNAALQAMSKYGVPEDKLCLVYKGHSFDWYQSTKIIELNYFNIPKDKFIIGCVANFRHSKGGSFLVDVMNLLKNKIPFHLVLIGEIFDSMILKKIKKYNLQDYISTIGFRSDAIDWIKYFDLSIMPSLRKESFSRSIVESMAQGIPVLVSEVGGMTELVQNEFNGFVFNACDKVDCLNKILKIFNSKDQLDNIKSNAKSTIKNKFDLDSYISNMEKVFFQKL